MKQTFSLKLMMGVLLFLLCLTVGCTKGGTDIITASPENAPAVRAAANKAEQMLKQGRDIDVILTALEDQLKESPRVYDVALESEIGSVSAVFVDGETHTFTLVDEEKQTDDLSYYSSNLAYDLESASPVIENDEATPFQQQAEGQGYYRMPANNKALLANSVNFFDGSKPNFLVTDSTELIHKMLAARGYEVNHATESLTPPGYEVVNKDLTIDLFNNLTQYGVIVIETHSGRRALKSPEELEGKENCGGYYSSFRIVTTELVTESKMSQYKKTKDVSCGRVSTQNRFTLKKGKKVVKDQFFVVTPNYIREHDKGTFPDNTLMLLSSCSAYLDDKSSPMRDLLFEKCNKGACFLGWTGKVSASIAIRAALNLFQLMTASNEELTGKEDFKALKKSTPPQGGEFTALERALGELKSNSYLTDPHNGASLELSKQDSETTDLILMPHPLHITGSNDFWVLDLYCDSQPTATVGGTEVSLENIGGSGWKISMPVGAYGDIVIRENERISIPRPLHRWRPQIKIDTTFIVSPFPFLHLNATVTLLARATIESWCFRDSILNDPPPATFDAYWDLDASNIAWKIDGEGTQTFDNGGYVQYKYNGSGLKSLRAINGDGNMWSFNGSTVSFGICGDLSFTMTIKSPEGTSQGETTAPFCATIWDNNLIALSDDWTVAGGSYQDNSGVDPVQINWNAFAAEPPFDMDNEPR